MIRCSFSFTCRKTPEDIRREEFEEEDQNPPNDFRDIEIFPQRDDMQVCSHSSIDFTKLIYCLHMFLFSNIIPQSKLTVAQ